MCPTMPHFFPLAPGCNTQLAWKIAEFGVALNNSWTTTRCMCFLGLQMLMENKLNKLSIDFPSFKQQTHPFELSAAVSVQICWPPGEGKQPSPEETVMFYMVHIWSTYGPHASMMIENRKTIQFFRQIVESKRITKISRVRNQVLQFYSQSC